MRVIVGRARAMIADGHPTFAPVYLSSLLLRFCSWQVLDTLLTVMALMNVGATTAPIVDNYYKL